MSKKYAVTETCVGLSDSVPLNGSEVAFLLCFRVGEGEISQLNAWV